MRENAPFLRLIPLLFAGFLAACSSQTAQRPVATGPASNAAQGSANFKVGKPYQINGMWYYPQESYSYDESGIASWYGDDFHNKRTANGEVFNKNELTAAHPTLQMPSLARVTNLENGRSIVVRINDRGPFSGARLIDVTQRAAQLLGFERQGTARVRVQVLADESKAIADAMRRYGTPANETGLAPAASAPPPAASGTLGTLSSRETQEAAVSSHVLPPVTAEPSVEVMPWGDEPLPQTKAQARAMMASIKPVPEARTVAVPEKTQLFIQAGAFSRYDNAAALHKKMARFGTAIISEVEVRGVKLYRVRIGPVPDVAMADKLLPKVRAAGAPDARTVVDTTGN